MESQAITLRLAADELALLIDALDALEYWEAGFALPRNNGEVFIPGDLLMADDRYWGPGTLPSPEEREAIEQVRRCRRLSTAFRLVALSAEASP
jgi:hypothetical protein